MNKLEEFWKATEPIYNSIIQHPFNQELAKGTLDEDKFRFYVAQDAIYIGEYSRALSVLAAKAPSHEMLHEFVAFAKEGLEIERELHDQFFKALNVKKAEKIALSTESYANYLLATVAYRSFEEGLAALLPCFWLYNEVAAYIYKIATPGNKYQKWIDTYSSAEFDETTDRLKKITLNLAEKSASHSAERMKAQFVRSAEYEWFFWDSAYNLKYW